MKQNYRNCNRHNINISDCYILIGIAMFLHTVYARMFTHFRNNPIRRSYWQSNVPRTRGLARGSR